MANCAGCYEKARGDQESLPSQPPLLGENILSARDSSESCNNLLEKSHLTSRVANDFLAKEVSVTQATTKKYPMDRWLWSWFGIWDASTDHTEPPGRVKERAEPILAPSFQDNGISNTHYLVPHRPTYQNNESRESQLLHASRRHSIKWELTWERRHHHRTWRELEEMGVARSSFSQTWSQHLDVIQDKGLEEPWVNSSRFKGQHRNILCCHCLLWNGHSIYSQAGMKTGTTLLESIWYYDSRAFKAVSIYLEI